MCSSIKALMVDMVGFAASQLSGQPCMLTSEGERVPYEACFHQAVIMALKPS
jgi:hypothetical protein